MASTDSEKAPPPEIINLVTINDVQGVKNLLLKGEGKVSDSDSNGMTPLHHAAYKGNSELTKIFLDHGSDVNDDSHDHRYSPLHFAALSGNIETVQDLLMAGARTYHTNTLGRTASQMAAFVGNHAVVALINNYVPLSSVSYYASPQGLDTEAKLPQSMVEPFYGLIMQVNLHPAKIALTVESSKELLDNISIAATVLNLMCEKESKRTESVNEVITMKFHYLAYVLKTLEKEISKLNSTEKSEDQEAIVFESIIRKWLRGRPSDGYEEQLEFYMRDAIKAFPYVEMPLFMQLVQNVSGSKVGESWALGILSGCINGQRAFQDDKGCATCGQERKDGKKCSKCKYVQYCDRRCQKLHWIIHKKFCDRLLLEYKKREKQLQEEKAAEELERQKKQLKNEENKESDISTDKELSSQTEKVAIT